MSTEPPPDRTDLINAAMGAQRLSNERLAKKAGVGPMTVSKIRNGYTQVGYVTLKKVVEALSFTMSEVSTPKAV
jgi:transcriptional regulator with XRE-family HTH domain